ncbi:snare associated Golgi protein-domain-containing protein [Gongronella butleri]|nr:snare associated Golgi protein-domain-containing protein [Gongronella butleri]
MDQHFFKVYVTFVVSFIYLQSFSIPGSMWLSVLGGALFPFWLTLITVCICSSIGASLAFLLSGSLGSKAIMHLFGARISKWNEQLVQHKQHMFNYMIVLRIAPLPPNWVVNLGAPHLGIPLFTFFWGTFLGVAPLSFIQIQAGAALDRLSSSDKLVIFTPLNIACLFGIAIAALIPVFVKRRYNM